MACMDDSEKTTITVDQRTLDRFKQLKAELDDEQKAVPDHTANSFMSALLDTWEAAEDGYYDNDEPIVAELSDNDIQEIINAVAAKADSEGRVDSDSLAREVASQLDYTELANQVANEVENRMR